MLIMSKKKDCSLMWARSTKHGLLLVVSGFKLYGRRAAKSYSHLEKRAFVAEHLVNGSGWDPHHRDHCNSPPQDLSPHRVRVLPIASGRVLDDAGDRHDLTSREGQP